MPDSSAALPPIAAHTPLARLGWRFHSRHYLADEDIGRVMRCWFPVMVVLCAVVLLSSGCAPRAGRCYLPATRYEPLKELFLESGSMADVEEAMEQENWAPCERNQLRYFLTRDLYLELLEREQLSRPERGPRFAGVGASGAKDGGG